MAVASAGLRALVMSPGMLRRDISRRFMTDKC